MPTYTFRDKTTGHTFDRWMKMSEREQYLKDNPTIEPMLTAPNVSISDGKKKPDDGFIDLMKNIRQKAIGGRHLTSRHF